MLFSLPVCSYHPTQPQRKTQTSSCCDNKFTWPPIFPPLPPLSLPQLLLQTVSLIWTPPLPWCWELQPLGAVRNKTLIMLFYLKTTFGNCKTIKLWNWLKQFKNKNTLAGFGTAVICSSHVLLLSPSSLQRIGLGSLRLSSGLCTQVLLPGRKGVSI